MTLEELITTLAAEDPRTLVPNGFGNPHSWRGSYYELAFEPESNVTVADMLEAARSADGATYTGWKGGDFTMNGYSDCHLAVEGSCGDELTPSVLAVMLAAGEVPDKQSDPRAGLWRVLLSVGVDEERAGLWLDAFAAAVRTAAIREAATEVDRLADEREQQAIEEDGRAYGMSDKTVAVQRDMAAHLFRLAAAPTATPTPEER